MLVNLIKKLLSNSSMKQKKTFMMKLLKLQFHLTKNWKTSQLRKLFYSLTYSRHSFSCKFL